MKMKKTLLNKFQEGRVYLIAPKGMRRIEITSNDREACLILQRYLNEEEEFNYMLVSESQGDNYSCMAIDVQNDDLISFNRLYKWFKLDYTKLKDAYDKSVIEEMVDMLEDTYTKLNNKDEEIVKFKYEFNGKGTILEGKMIQKPFYPTGIDKKFVKIESGNTIYEIPVKNLINYKEEKEMSVREKICKNIMAWELSQNDDGSVEVKGYKPQYNQSNQFYRYFIEVATDEFIDTVKFMSGDNIKAVNMEQFLYLVWTEIIKDRSILEKIYVYRQFNKYADYMAKVEEIKKEDISVYMYDSTYIVELDESQFEKIRDNERQNIYCFLYGKKGENIFLIGHLDVNSDPEWKLNLKDELKEF